MDGYIKFLGTAGARFVVAKQLRSSAGILIHGDEKDIILDPGPGTLVRCASSRPPIDVTKLEALILTHAHIDHSNDVNVLIDAMTEGGLKKRGTLFAPRECLEGVNAVVLRYLREYLQDIIILEAEERYHLDSLEFSTSVRHQHPVETYGLKINIASKRVAFLVDTKFFPQLIESYRDADILVLNVVRRQQDPNRDIMHLNIDDARKIISAIRPSKAVLTHFGMTMIRAKPRQVAEELSEELGLEILAASDGMKLEIS